MIAIRLAALAFLLPVLCLSAFARDYIVDGPNAAAADTNEGTSERPLKTINRAAQVVEPGDVVRVKAGIYRETVRLLGSGRPEAPILFTAEPAGSVTITGADPLTSWQKVPGDTPIYRAAWPHVFAIDFKDGKPVEFHPPEEPLWGRAEQVIADGIQLLPARDTSALEESWKRHSQALRENRASEVVAPPLHGMGDRFNGLFTVSGTNDSRELRIWLADGSDPNVHKLEAATRQQLFGVNPWELKEGVHDIQVRGFVFQYGASFPQRAAVWLHGRNNLVEQCVIRDMVGSGVNVGGTLRHCLIVGCGQTGGAATGDGFRNEECVWEGNSWRPLDRGWDSGGVKLTDAKNGVFRRCLFRRNCGAGLWFDVDVRNVLVTECVFEENEGSGLFIEISRDIQVIHNLAIGNSIGVVGPGEPLWWSDGGIKIAESRNCTVAFNTCVGNKDGITFREQGPRPLRTKDDGTVSYSNRGGTVLGNVCAFNRGYQFGVWYDNAFFGPHPSDNLKLTTEEQQQEWLKRRPDLVPYDPTKQDHIVDRNLYFAESGQEMILYGAPWRFRFKTFADPSAFAAATGFDARSRVADPLFRNRSSRDFRFAPGSPAAEMQAGWSDAPASIDRWAAEFVPAYVQWRPTNAGRE